MPKKLLSLLAEEITEQGFGRYFKDAILSSGQRIGDVKSVDLERACSLTPGIESPTISPLQKSGWNAVRAMVKRSDINRIMDELWQVGARGILVTDIHACRL